MQNRKKVLFISTDISATTAEGPALHFLGPVCKSERILHKTCIVIVRHSVALKRYLRLLTQKLTHSNVHD